MLPAFQASSILRIHTFYLRDSTTILGFFNLEQLPTILNAIAYLQLSYVFKRLEVTEFTHP